ncbi:hypothetical protein BB559_001773 [Furculomyces boomerangus]|uniref:Dilute domain-containing protein n=2 Tax=Harpellales TaxID=61421 RepID=A0A2T9Z0K1_9FUNG|nr:hypothetical protein BB559_001773 [Furculomyces boomerangus]PVZ99268.1 hypothetical protein BB558_004715 [Smittium angustum]
MSKHLENNTTRNSVEIISENNGLKITKLKKYQDSPDSALMIDEFSIVGDKTLSIKEKKDKLNQNFRLAAQSGNVKKLEAMWSHWNSAGWLEIDRKDEDGLSPLITACCFGHLQAAKFLLDHGANVNISDQSGWTGLMWATNNNHDDIVKLLLTHDASPTARSTRGHTAMNLACINAPPPTPDKDIDSTTRINNRKSIISVNSETTKKSSPTQSENKAFGQELSASNKKRNRTSKLIELLQTKTPSPISQEFENGLADDIENSPKNNDPLSTDESRDENKENALDFNWDEVLPHQMYAVPQTNLGKFLRALITNNDIGKLLEYRTTRLIPSNMLFLALRFTATFDGQEALDFFLYEAIASIVYAIQSSKKSIVNLSFWQSNAHMLHYYLNRDSTLKKHSKIGSERLLQSIFDSYTLYQKAVCENLSECLDESVLDYTKMPELFDGVEFEKEVRQSMIMSFFSTKQSESTNPSRLSVTGKPLQRSKSTMGRNWKNKPSLEMHAQKQETTVKKPQERSRLSMFFRHEPQPIETNNAPRNSFNTPPSSRASIADLENQVSEKRPTPQTIIFVIEDYIQILKKSFVHNFIISQGVEQLLQNLCMEMFNRVLTTKEFCCRLRAMSIRMNLATLEEWIHERNNDIFLIKNKETFGPLIELLQLLQVITSLNDFNSFLEMIEGFKHINMLHLDAIIKNYRYEIGEQRISPQIICYVEPAATRIREIKAEIKSLKQKQDINKMKLSDEYKEDRGDVYLGTGFLAENYNVGSESDSSAKTSSEMVRNIQSIDINRITPSGGIVSVHESIPELAANNNNQLGLLKKRNSKRRSNRMSRQLNLYSAINSGFSKSFKSSSLGSGNYPVLGGPSLGLKKSPTQEISETKVGDSIKHRSIIINPDAFSGGADNRNERNKIRMSRPVSFQAVQRTLSNVPQYVDSRKSEANLMDPVRQSLGVSAIKMKSEPDGTTLGKNPGAKFLAYLDNAHSSSSYSIETLRSIKDLYDTEDVKALEIPSTEEYLSFWANQGDQNDLPIIVKIKTDECGGKDTEKREGLGNEEYGESDSELEETLSGKSVDSETDSDDINKRVELIPLVPDSYLVGFDGL